MLPSIILRLTVLTLCFACSGSMQEGMGIGPGLRGAWQEQGEERFLHIQKDQIVEFTNQKGLTVRGFVRWEQDQLVLRCSGREEKWTPSLQSGRLRLDGPEGVHTFVRLDEVPPEVELKPLVLGASNPLPPERTQAIQAEIESRFRAEQELFRAIWKNRERRPEADQLKRENLVYLSTLLREVGWIDAARFGAKTSVYTVILAKHTGDLRLMMTILPLAEKDLKNSEEGQTYAVLYDALQLDLGHKQLYGTQIAEDEDGPYVLPFEGSEENVEQRLRALGLPSFAEYRTEVGKALYSGKQVRLARNEH
jgi:hypothetical protein